MEQAKFKQFYLFKRLFQKSQRKKTFYFFMLPVLF